MNFEILFLAFQKKTKYNGCKINIYVLSIKHIFYVGIVQFGTCFEIFVFVPFKFLFKMDFFVWQVLIFLMSEKFGEEEF